MNTTFQFASAQDVSPAILEAIRQAYQEKPISIYIQEDELFPEQAILQPDDDLRSAITGDELLERIYQDIDRKFVNRI
jgi:hypothetical protein